MKRLLLSAFIAIAAFASSSAASNYDKYYEGNPIELKRVTPFELKAGGVNLRDFGAKGDGLTLCTEAFARAFAELEKRGGGRLTVPAGVWLTGPITMRSNVELHVERNAVILFSPDKSLYIDPKPKASRVRPCIGGDRLENIAVTGQGIIDGNGAQWRPVKRMKVSDAEWKRFKAMGGVERAEGSLWYPWELKSGVKDFAKSPEVQERMRNDLFRVTNCKNIYLSGVTFQNSPKFHVHPFYSDNVIIDGITVRCPWNAQNGDAIDISDCHRVLIVNATVDCGDDGLCMKSGEFKPKSEVNGVEDVMIRDCTVYHAHGGFVIGSEAMTAMRRIVVRDCTFSGTDTGLRFKSGEGRGGKTEQIFISDITMTDIADDAIVFECTYADRPAGGKVETKPTEADTKFIPEFADIHISGITCRGTETAIAASGIAGRNCIHDVTVENSTIIYTTTPTKIDEATARIALKNVNLVKEQF